MKPIHIPKVSDYLDAQALELQAQRNDLGARLVRIERERLEYIREEVPAEEATHPDAVRLATLLGSPPPPIVPDRRTKLAQFAEDIRILKSAIAVLDGKIRAHRVKAEHAVRANVTTLYRERITAICDVFQKLHQANLELRQVTSALEEDGVSWEGLGVVAPNAVGWPTDPHSPAGTYLRDAAQQGFIAKADVPRELRG